MKDDACIPGTRIYMSTLYLPYRVGDTIPEIAQWYSVPEEWVCLAIKHDTGRYPLVPIQDRYGALVCPFRFLYFPNKKDR